MLLVFSEDDDYYHYLSHFSMDGEQPASGGVSIRGGYPHIAIPWRDHSDAAYALVHELTHDCLGHLSLPLWLNEGVAVKLQKAVAPPQLPLGQGEQTSLYAAAINWNPPVMWDELAERHFSFWSRENIQAFWAGTSFFEPGDASELSYSLAEVLVNLLTEKATRGDFQAFLDAARQDDAGQTAAWDILGLKLGELAGTFLGQGDWQPQRKELIEFWERAGWERRPG